MKKKIVLILTTLMCISLCACGTTEKEIEITMDNWQDYFEFKEIVLPWNTYNAFNELESENVITNYCVVLKDKYEINEEKSKVAIEFTGYIQEWSINADMSTLEVDYIEKIRDIDFGFDTGETVYTRTGEFSNIRFKNGEKEYYGILLSPQGEPNLTWYNEETTIRTNQRYFLDEVVRIKGTIYIIEK